ncbi:LLM class flavin-dependent oxidoreductase [Aquamicrobium sp. LC103]|uniref:LLM class flavin-dependent oxidoreductase n=1 Tax=Aquamicrobium sp. LC103 TaxID=1120658 RepID=UPI00063EB537|nr:LLM class flavin-dependent oxidoreductase [Aquamicrobium sp. LC103]TKT75738.1 LLM class flavin-dependent oxidoreductase [Aquamicrobium sp. LC103]
MKQMVLSALDMSCVGFLAQGVWSHPNDRSTQLNSLAYWTDYAKLLERGLFDMLFIADAIGVYDVYGGSKDAAVRGGVQMPMNDPWVAISGMAAVTSHLGFGITGNLIYEPPFLFARRMATLDHLTGGRVGWNIVTGILSSGARAMGRASIVPHDERYDMADEYLELMYRLWEGSWDEDAVRLDADAHIFADPAKVHVISHAGKYFRMEGMLPCMPSPQRTPLIMQAGASGRGKQFAAANAECVFVNGVSKAQVAASVSDIRRRAVEQGRGADNVKILAGTTIVVARTEAEAKEKEAEYRRFADPEAVLAHAAGGIGVDLSKYPLDEVLRYEATDANRTSMEMYTRNPARTYTPRQIAEEMAISARNLLIVGSAEQVADELASWMEETGVDGFNIARLIMPGSLEAFIDLVVPLLQERGLHKSAYRDGTLREKLFGAGPLLRSPHPAAAARTVA